MRERPILFSAPMVRALLDGSKTQTRRIVKLPHENALGQWEPTKIGGANGGRTSAGSVIPEQGAIWHTRTGDCLASPYGQPDDRLIVRETWQFYDWTKDGEPCIRYAADNATVWPANVHDEKLVDHWELLSRPDNFNIDNRARDRRWRPSIHMPRWASRILLEIVSVRVERLQDISEADAIAEGLKRTADGHAWNVEDERHRAANPIDAYASLWEAINGAGSWSANPWVWCVEFRRVLP